MKTRTQDASGLLSLIAMDPERAWARPDEFLKSARDSRSALDKLKCQTTFGRNWTVQDAWSKWVKREHKDHQAVEKQWKQGVGGLRSAIHTLGKEVMRIKNMHRGRRIN